MANVLREQIKSQTFLKDLYLFILLLVEIRKQFLNGLKTLLNMPRLFCFIFPPSLVLRFSQIKMSIFIYYQLDVAYLINSEH